jgi:hypothetical protein
MRSNFPVCTPTVIFLASRKAIGALNAVAKSSNPPINSPRSPAHALSRIVTIYLRTISVFTYALPDKSVIYRAISIQEGRRNASFYIAPFAHTAYTLL